MDSVRLCSWKDRRITEQKGFGRIFPVLPEAARESVANDNAIPRDDPAEGWYFPAVSPQSFVILSILTYRNSPPSAVERGSSPSFTHNRCQSNFYRASSSRLDRFELSSPAAAVDPCRFLDKNFRCTACTKLLCQQLCRFDSRRTMYSLEQWSFGIFSFLDIYIAFSKTILSSGDYRFSSCFLL